MSELEKMLAGQLYDASDPTLIEMRYKARALFSAYNRIPYDADPERRAVLD